MIMSLKFPIIKASVLESLCKEIADTSKGLTGSELTKSIADSKMVDVNPEMTKWRRLYNSCVEVQNRTKCSNNVLSLIQNAYHPSKYLNDKN